MSKPYSDVDFTTQITEDRTWRLREISDLKNAAIQADFSLRRVLLRSLTTMCYAHWEGYVRFAARKYLQHIALRKLQYKELDRQFLRNYFLPRLAATAIIRASMKDRCALVDDLLGASERRFSRVNEDLVNTRSNLNFEVFTDICLVCGLSSALFLDKADFMDVFLLKRRNSIAHGEESYIEVADLQALTNETVALMRAFGDALENQVYLRGYKAS